MQFNLDYPPKRTNLYLEDYPVSFGTFVSERAEEGIEAGVTSSFGRMTEQGALRLRDEEEERDPLSVSDIGVDVPINQAPDLVPITQEEARTRAAEAGFPGLEFPEEGTTQQYTDWLITRQQVEARRNSLRMRTPDTLGYSATGLALDFLTAAADPGNVAAAFVIPAGSVARNLSSAGARAAARFRLGAMGAAGESILTEPIVFSQMQQEQLDYTLFDSLANVTIGALAGGSLRSVGGFTADVIRRRAEITPPSQPTPVSEAVTEITQRIRKDDLILANLKKTDQEQIMKTALSQFFNDQPIFLDSHIDVLRMRESGTILRRPTEEELFERFRQEQFRIAQEADLTSQADITVAQRAVNEAMTDLRRIEDSRETRLEAATSRTQKKKVHREVNKELERARVRAERAESAALATSSTKRALKDDQQMRQGVMPERLRSAYNAFKEEELKTWDRITDRVAKRGRMTPVSAAVKKGIEDIDTNARQDVIADVQDHTYNKTKMADLPEDNQLLDDLDDLDREIQQANPELDIESALREIDPGYRDKSIISDSFQRLAACL